MRLRPVVTLNQPLPRDSDTQHFDSPLGNVIADAHLYFANQYGQADMAFINEGSLRSDLPSGQRQLPVKITFGDLYAAQPFGNSLIRMQLSGAQIMQLLQQQWADKTAKEPKKLFVSDSLSYSWKRGNGADVQIDDIKIKGQPLNLNQEYIVVANNF